MTKIAWTEQTWNPVVGCSKVSDGCLNCYAEKMAKRLRAMDVRGYDECILHDDGGWNGGTTFLPEALDKPLKRKMPTMYFVCSMGDLFQGSVEPDWIYEVMDVISRCPQHTFQILTKRADRMQSYIQHSWLDRGNEFLPNLWLGVTAENQATADERIPHLLATPAAVRFVSCEPMLAPVELQLIGCPFCGESKQPWYPNYTICRACGNEVKSPPENTIDWVICGCESGPGRRGCLRLWQSDLLHQCQIAGVPFFMKQMEYAGKVVKDIERFSPMYRVREWPKGSTS